MNARSLMIAGSLGIVLAAGMVGAGVVDPPDKAREQSVAIVGDRVIAWSNLTPMLAEAAGGQVLEEYALGVVLREECDKRGIRIGEAQTRAERTLLGEMLAKAARLPTSEGEGLIQSVRRTRGLGDIRFKGLLERNAALRAMVRAGVGDAPITITREDIDTAYDLKFGARVRARLILLRSQRSAEQAEARLGAGAPFAEVAGEMSLDPSGARGGMLDPFSLSDSTYPVAVRRVLGELPAGKTSDPIAVTWADEPGFAIVKLEENIAPAVNAPSKEAAAKELELEVRTVRERAQMDKLAKKLLHNAGVTAMDPSLNWSWEQRKGAGTP